MRGTVIYRSCGEFVRGTVTHSSEVSDVCWERATQTPHSSETLHPQPQRSLRQDGKGPLEPGCPGEKNGNVVCAAVTCSNRRALSQRKLVRRRLKYKNAAFPFPRLFPFWFASRVSLCLFRSLPDLLYRRTVGSTYVPFPRFPEHRPIDPLFACLSHAQREFTAVRNNFSFQPRLCLLCHERDATALCAV